jgi:hypothetical protein
MGMVEKERKMRHFLRFCLGALLIIAAFVLPAGAADEKATVRVVLLDMSSLMHTGMMGPGMMGPGIMADGSQREEHFRHAARARMRLAF